MGKVGRFLLGVGLIVGGILLSPFTGGLSLGLTMLGTNMAMRALFKPVGLANALTVIKQTVASPVAALPIIYGEMKVGLRLADMRVNPSSTKNLYMVGCLAHACQLDGSGVDDIREVYFGEDLAFDAAGTLQTKFKKDGDARAWLTKHLGGLSQTADSDLTTIFSGKWTASHRGRGVAYILLRLLFDADVYQSVPQVTVKVRGLHLLDPRNASLTYVSFGSVAMLNPALAILDYLLNPYYGLDTGRKVQLATSDLTNSGFGNFSAASALDGNPDTSAWENGGVSAGAYLKFDMQYARELDRLDLWLSTLDGATSQDQYLVQWSDDGSSGWTSVVGLTTQFRTPGLNCFRWNSRRSGAHRYWRLYLNNAPTAAYGIGGADWYETEIDWQAFEDAANYCEAVVNVPPAESAFKTITAIDTGTGRLTVPGHPWTSGNVVNFALMPGFGSAGTLFVYVPGQGSIPLENGTYTITKIDNDTITLDEVDGWAGTYTASSLRAGALVGTERFKINGAIDTGSEPAEVLRQLLTACRGRLIYQNGRYRLFIKQVQSASLTLTEDDLVGNLKFTLPGNREKFNKVRVTYVDPLNNYQPDVIEAPRAGLLNPFLVADNNFESVMEIELPLTQSKYTALQIGLVALRESREGITVEATLRERGLLAQTGDVVAFAVPNSTPGWSDKQFCVEQIAVTRDGYIQLVATEYEAANYGVDYVPLQAVTPNTDLPDAMTDPAAPTNLVLGTSDSDMLVQPNGDLIMRLKASWTASTNPFVAHYEVEARRHTDTNYDLWPHVPGDGTLEAFIYPLAIGDQWDVRVRAVTTLGRKSPWLSGSYTVPSTIRRPIARGIVEPFTDFPGSPARWSSGGFNAVVVQEGNPEFGGGILQVIGGTSTWQTLIPIERNCLYSLRYRCRRVRNGQVPANDTINFGFRCYNSKGQEITRDKGFVPGSSFSTRLAYDQLLSPSSLWTEYVGYFQGWNGGWYLPPASVLTNSGFGNFTAANVGDADPSTKAFDSDAASAGATITLDLGVGITKLFSAVRFFMEAAGSTAQYKFQYSDNGSSWTDFTTRAGATWVPSNLGWNQTEFAEIGAAHRYWRIVLNNTPGAGPDVYEVAFIEVGSFVNVGPQVYNNPQSPLKMAPGTCFIAPVMTINSSGSPDAILEVDLIEMPPAAGATGLL
jgi:hypothetical protein